MYSSTFGEQLVNRSTLLELVNCGHGNAIPANGARRTVYAPFILERLKSARAIRYTRVYRESDDDLLGPVPREIAVGPGCSVASAAEMKELIYLPESYNSLSTCIHTLSLVFLTGPSSLVPVPLQPSAALGSFSFLSLFILSSPSLSALSKFLALSSSLGDETRRLLPLCTFCALFAWLCMRIISERPCPWRTWMRLRNLVSNLFSLPPLLRFYVYANVYALYLNVYMLIYAYLCVRRTLNFPYRIFPQHRIYSTEFTLHIFFYLLWTSSRFFCLIILLVHGNYIVLPL